MIGGRGDIGYEESEMLIPMCDIEINNHYQAKNGKIMANATIVRQKDPIEIMEKRLEEMRDMIIQYGGKKELEELRAKVQVIKSKSNKKTKHSLDEFYGVAINDRSETTNEATRETTQGVRTEGELEQDNNKKLEEI